MNNNKRLRTPPYTSVLKVNYKYLQEGTFSEKYFLDNFSTCLQYYYKDVKAPYEFLVFGQTFTGEVRHTGSGVVYSISGWSTGNVTVKKVL